MGGGEAGGVGAWLLEDGDAGQVGSPLDLLVARPLREGYWPFESPETGGRDPIPEENQGASPIVLAGNPDQPIDALIANVERSGPGGRTGVIFGVGLDELQPGYTEAPETMPKEPGQGQVAIAVNGGSHQALQLEPADPLSRAADRHAVENRLGEGSLEIARSIEGRNDPSLGIRKRVKTAASALAGIEFRRTESGIVTPDERMARLPGEQERPEV